MFHYIFQFLWIITGVCQCLFNCSVLWSAEPQPNPFILLASLISRGAVSDFTVPPHDHKGKWKGKVFPVLGMKAGRGS